MSSFAQSFIIGVLCVFIALFLGSLVALKAYFKYKYQYWKRRGIPYIEPKLPLGTLRLRPKDGKPIHSALLTAEFYEKFKEQGAKIGGLYFLDDPACLLVDNEYVKNILLKDFNVFHSRGFHIDHKKNPLHGNIFSLDGSRWRTLRTKLSPTFTSGKLKTMFGTLIDCLIPMNQRFSELYENSDPVDVKDVISCYTTDVIGSCAFGIDCNSFADKNNLFRVHGKNFFAPSKWGNLIRLIAMKFPFLKNYFNFGGTPKNIRAFYINVVRDTMKHRKDNNIKRNDFLELLIELYDQQVLVMDEVSAQSFVFFLAGFETSSTTSTFVLYLLAKHQDIQERVRKEIERVLEKHEGKITYEAIQEMKYLDQVIAESQRIYPPVGQLTRRCMEDYKLRDENFIIEKGTLMIISIYGIHHDPEYYPEPEKFDPERFNEENIKTRPSMTHIPFGEGPRLCIGMRFGLMETKVAIVDILRSYKLTVNKKTIEPLTIDPGSSVLAAKGDVFLDLHKL